MEALYLVITVALVGGLLWLAARGPRFMRLWRAKRLERRRDPQPRLTAARLEIIVTELLAQRGFELEAAHHEGMAIAHGPRDARRVVRVASSPPQERVSADQVHDLAHEVVRLHADGGLLVTPYHIDRARAPDAPVALELIDGRGLLAAVERELPHLLGELRRFRLTGTERASLGGDRRAGAMVPN